MRILTKLVQGLRSSRRLKIAILHWLQDWCHSYSRFYCVR